MGLADKIREAESQACLGSILELASILPGRIGGVEGLLLRSRMEALSESQGSPRPAGGGDFGVQSGSTQASGHSTSGGGSRVADVDLESISRLGHALLGLTTRVKQGTSQPPSLSLGGASTVASPPGPSSPSLPSTRSRVLDDDDLLHEVFQCLVGTSPGPSQRSSLGVLCLVSRRWAALATQEGYWTHIARALSPLMADLGTLDPSAVPERLAWLDGRKMGHRAYLQRYGRALVGRRLRRLSDWKDGLLLQFEVFDGMDGLRVYSAVGPIKVTAIADSHVTSLRLCSTSRREVTNAFCAADRDPGLHRFATIRDYFKHGHDAAYAAALSVRISVLDAKTGKMALLYDASKCAKSSAGAQPSDYWQQFLPPGSLDVCDSWMWMAQGDEAAAMEMRVGFFVGPEANQSGVSDQQRRYRIVARDWHRSDAQQDASLMFLYFKSLDGRAIGKFIRGLLEG